MEVRDHEVGVAQLPIERRNAQHDPGQTGDQKLKQERHAEKHRRLEYQILPPHMVPSQLNIFIPVGTAIAMVDATKKALPYDVMPTVNMWWAHTLMLMKPIATRGRHHDGIAEDGFARKHRNDLGDEGERGHDQDINFGMAEDPEEVHPDDRRSTRLGVEEVAAQIAIDQQHDLRGGQRAQGKHHQASASPGSARRTAASCPSVIPGQRMQKIVVTMLTAVAMLPKPLISSPMIQ